MKEEYEERKIAAKRIKQIGIALMLISIPVALYFAYLEKEVRMFVSFAVFATLGLIQYQIGALMSNQNYILRKVTDRDE